MITKNIFCPNEKCKLFGEFSKGNLKVKQTQGKCQYIKLMICTECGKTFSERKGTTYFGIHYPNENFDEVMALLTTRLSIREISRISKVSQKTIYRWIKKASRYMKAFQDSVVKDLSVIECQVDEMWSFVLMKRKTVKNNHINDDNVGDQWIFLAIDSISKLIIHWKTGKRTLENAKTFIKELKEKIKTSPLFTTDEWIGYEEAFLSNFSEEKAPEIIKKVGRPKTKPIIEVDKTLKLAQVRKTRNKGKVTDIKTKIIYGKEEEINKILEESLVSNTINTSFIERYNGTLRSKNSRVVRQTYSFSKDLDMHKAHLEISFVFYNFMWEHSRYKMTAGQLAGLINRVISFKDIFCLRIL